jgi:hypothetical protein
MTVNQWTMADPDSKARASSFVELTPAAGNHLFN